MENVDALSKMNRRTGHRNSDAVQIKLAIELNMVSVIFRLQHWFFGKCQQRTRLYIVGLTRRYLRNGWGDHTCRRLMSSLVNRVTHGWKLEPLAANFLDESHPLMQDQFTKIMETYRASKDVTSFVEKQRPRKRRRFTDTDSSCSDSSSEDNDGTFRWVGSHVQASSRMGEEWSNVGKRVEELQTSGVYRGICAVTPRESEALELARIPLPTQSRATCVDVSQSSKMVQNSRMGLSCCVAPTGRLFHNGKLRFAMGL